jgi:hypothetical protein
MAIRIEDSDPVEIILGGKVFQAGKLIHQMRMNLMTQHLGLNSSHAGLS